MPLPPNSFIHTGANTLWEKPLYIIKPRHRSNTTTVADAEQSTTTVESGGPGQPCDSRSSITPTQTTLTADMIASLTNESFPARANGAHCERAHPFTKTRQMIRHKTATMFVNALRNGRGHLTTKQTKPRLPLKRRYSVDVVADEWHQGHQRLKPASIEGETVLDTSAIEYFVPIKQECKELEPPVQRKPVMSLPNPRRHHSLHRGYLPPMNEEIYLELNNSLLSNSEFRFITDVGETLEVWMRDNALNTALEVISMENNCRAHGIEIANSMISSILYQVGVLGDISNDNFAGYETEKERFRDKNWIFLPINDGFGAIDYDSTGGSHWSFVIVDRIHNMAWYVDSLFIHKSEYCHMASGVLKGLMNILDEQYNAGIMDNSPNQYMYNQFKEDVGPCGPFVYKMIEIIVQDIRWHQEMDREDEVNLWFPAHMPLWFKTQFDSRDVRLEMQWKIGRTKLRIESQKSAEKHDLEILAGLEDGYILVDESEPEPKPKPVRFPRFPYEAGIEELVEQFQELPEFHPDANSQDDFQMDYLNWVIHGDPTEEDVEGSDDATVTDIRLVNDEG